ncbi:hypothetical protein QZH41_019780, partial [Actinostola sp. cb2023]
MDDASPRRFRLSVSEGRPVFVNEFNKPRGVESGDLRNRFASSKLKLASTELYGRMSSHEPPFLSPHSYDHDKLRSTRSHSLKVFTMQPSFLYQRSKRTFSLPCTTRPIFPPTIQIEQSRFVDEDIIEEPGNKPVAVEDTFYTHRLTEFCLLIDACDSATRFASERQDLGTCSQEEWRYLGVFHRSDGLQLQFASICMVMSVIQLLQRQDM